MGQVSRLKVLLRPGWIVLVLVVAGFAWVCFTQLAPWQLGKNTATEARNDRISASFAEAPVELSSLVSAPSGPTVDQEWRVVTTTGSYLVSEQVLARLRTVDGTAAYEVLVPFRTDAGDTVLVDRGYVRPVVGTSAPAVDPAPAGTVTLQARVRRDEPVDPTRAPLLVRGVEQVYGINAGTVAELSGTTISPGYLQLTDGAPGVLGVLPLPQTDSGPYLSYGLQWLAFGIMAPLGLAYFVRAELRERRRDRESADGDDRAGDGAVPAPAPERRRRRRGVDPRDTHDPRDVAPPVLVPDRSPDLPPEKMLDRYGRRR